MVTSEMSARNLPRTVLLIATIVRQQLRPTPFDDGATGDSYAHLAALCAEGGLGLLLTHHANLRSPTTALAWRWHGAPTAQGQAPGWRALECSLAEVDLAYADLPQNFPEALAFKEALIAHKVPVINDLRLSDQLTDKALTYELFPEHVPTTWCTAEPDLKRRLRSVAIHPDLDLERLVLKPRFGERGRGISWTDPRGLPAHPDAARPDFIVQPFLETNGGIPELGIRDRHDLRLILCDGTIELCFARIPKAGSYVSNCSQGGREVCIDPDQLPARVKDFAARIDARLHEFGPRLYSLDLGIGRSGKIWIYELNTMPGIVWDDAVPENRPLHEAMHRVLARWMAAAIANRNYAVANGALSRDPAVAWAAAH